MREEVDVGVGTTLFHAHCIARTMRATNVAKRFFPARTRPCQHGYNAETASVSGYVIPNSTFLALDRGADPANALP